MGTMRAVRAHTRGGAEKLTFERAPIPVPAGDEVLIAVHAAAITYDELLWDESWTRGGVDRTPIIPSHEVSGTIVAIGDAVTTLAVGQDVYGLIEFDRDGAAADYVTAPATQIAVKPSSIDHVQAAALPLAALTAWQALVDHAHLNVGESVLVLGGAGGVGAYVVQLAKHLGARVTATIRTADTEAYVRNLGADAVFVQAAQGTFDVVVDTVGGAALAAAYPLVRAGGRVITVSAPPGPELRQGRDVHDEFFVVSPDRAELEALATLVDGGALTALPSQTFALERTAQAYQDRGRPGGPGKTVLRIR
jgi:NADPH:quinone reductase-like Zn-dependent oxidoreductase